MNTKINEGDRFYVFRIGSTPYKLKGVAVKICGDLIVDEYGWFYKLEWCKLLIKEKGVLCG